MGRAYSEDLRKRVVESVDGGLSKMQVCRTYRIARSTLDDWLALREQTGQVAPPVAARRGPAPVLADQPEVHEFIVLHQHRTLSQMALGWEQKTGQRLSRMTFCKALRRLGYTRKKELSLLRARPTTTASVLGASSVEEHPLTVFTWMKRVSKTLWITPLAGVGAARAV